MDIHLNSNKYVQKENKRKQVTAKLLQYQALFSSHNVFVKILSHACPVLIVK